MSNWTEEQQEVAPYVGAWIETLRMAEATARSARRTLCGCVD